MHPVLDITLPVFLIGILGYCAVRFGFFSDTETKSLAKFVFNFAIPLMLVRTFSSTDALATLPWKLLLAYYIPISIFYLAGMAISRFIFKRPFDGQVITGFSCSYGNLILLGLPLTLLAFGEDGSIPMFMILAVHTLLLFSVTTTLLEFDRSRHASTLNTILNTVKGLAGNPIVMGIAVGISMYILEIRLPETIDQLAHYMQGAVLPCSIFAVGASLTQYRIAGRLKQTAMVLFLKNLLFPATVWLSCWYIFSLPPLWCAVATLVAAQPVGVNVFIFAERYKTGQALTSTAVFLSTLLSIITLPLLLILFDSYGLR